VTNIVKIILVLSCLSLFGCGGGGGGGSTSSQSPANSQSPETYNVTSISGANGSISPSTAQTVNSGAATSFTVTPASGYHISSVAGCGGTLNGGTYTTAAITDACTVSASFSATAAPTTAVINISTQGTLATALSGVGITLNLPAGVTVTTNSDGSVASGVVVASGVAQNNSTFVSTYTAASGSTGATLAITVASTSVAGFGTGEFVTVNTNIGSGYNPQATDFSLTNFEPGDLSGNLVTGLTATFSAAFQ
jgi:hypothetical protein